MTFDPKPLRVAAAAKGDNSVAAISRRLAAPYATVIRWTNGSSTPAGPALATIERTYGVTAGDLFPADA
ncbi:hypothetical protein ACWDN6_14690 [Streptomyces albogriseolus]